MKLIQKLKCIFKGHSYRYVQDILDVDSKGKRMLKNQVTCEHCGSRYTFENTNDNVIGVKFEVVDETNTKT